MRKWLVWVSVCSIVLRFVPGCGDHLSSTYPEMKAFVYEQGFHSQPQPPAPAKLGETAPWYGIATKAGFEYIVVIYPTAKRLYTFPLGIDGRLTRSQMIERIAQKGFQSADERVMLDGQSVSFTDDKFKFIWTYLDDKGFPSAYFDLSGNPISNADAKDQSYTFRIP